MNIQEPSSSYLEDASGFRGHAEAVLIPAGEAELISILERSTNEGRPLTIAGAGTGVTGGGVAQGGWVVSLEKFRTLQIDRGSAVAGAGVLLSELHAAAARTGQFYPPDPTEIAAAVGGTIATNASGSRSFLYGSTRRWIRRLRVAFMDGTVRTFASGDRIDFPVAAVASPTTTKHSAGYRLAPGMEWIDLLAGSEGTLAIVIEAELTLLPLPAALLTGVVFFATDARAIHAVDEWRACAGMRMIEYFDRGSLKLLRSRFPETPEAEAALLIEQELDSEQDEKIDAWPDRLEEAGGLIETSWFGTTAADRERFRRYRHALPETINDFMRRHGYLKLGSDYAVPLEKNGEMLSIYRTRLEQRFSGSYMIFGHIGDAHLHVNILPATQEDFVAAQALMLEFARNAVALGGTVGAEHGLGKRKRHLLAIQYTPQEVDAMRQVKLRLDPLWLLGRGNLFD